MAQALDWAVKTAYAHRLTTLQLYHAIKDCHLAGLAVGEHTFGKDASYYRDEASVYQAELRRRAAKGR